MTIKSDISASQFNLRLERVFGSNSRTSQRLGKEASNSIKDEIEDLLAEMRKELLQEVNSEIDTLVKQATKEVLGNNSFAKGIGNALDTAIGQAIAGRGIDTRSVANSAARAFTPIVNDLLRQSSSQAADELSSLFGLAQRNL